MTTLTVRFVDLDPYGHVNHAVYLSYFEQGRIDLLASKGFSLTDLRTRGFHLIVVETTVKFLAPLVENDRVDVTSTVVEVRPASSRWEQQIMRNHVVAATSQLRIAVTDTEGVPVRAPQDFAVALARMQASEAVVQ